MLLTTYLTALMGPSMAMLLNVVNNIAKEYSTTLFMTVDFNPEQVVRLCLCSTAKNNQVVAMLMKTGLNNVSLPTVVHSCQQYLTILLHPIHAQQYCSILLTCVNNVGSKTLFNILILLNSRLCVFTHVRLDATLHTVLYALHVIRIIEVLL